MPRTNDSNRQNKSVGSYLSKFWKKKNCPNQLLWYIDFETKHETIFLQCQPLLAICEFLWLLANQNVWFVTFFALN